MNSIPELARARVFVATASIKDWKKYLANRASADFKPTHRKWLGGAYDVISPVYPDYFTRLS